MNLKEIIKQNKSAAPKSFTLLFVLPAVVLSGFILARFYFIQSFFTLPYCLFRRVTGYNCPVCGSTRSVRALIHFHFLESFMFNPLPILVSVFMLAFWIHAFVNVFYKKRDTAFPGFFISFYSCLGFLLIFCVLRNLSLV